MNSTATDTVLAVRHFTKSYNGHNVVEDLSFSLSRGKVVGLIGPNGAGKTTIMKALIGLVAPSGGDLEILGTPVGGRGWGRVLSGVGAMIESPALYGRMMARQNLEYQALAIGQRIDRGRIDELLAFVGLADEATMQPRRFSLGMKQRLGIGIALLGRPELVILDEPANGLDPAGIMEIRHLLRELPKLGTTVLVSSHQLAEVQHACDSLIILDQGRLVTAGTTADIVAGHAEHAFVLEFRPDDLAAAKATIVAAGWSAETESDRLIVKPPTDVGGRDLIRCLVADDLIPETVAPKTVSLEEAFLDLTTAR